MYPIPTMNQGIATSPTPTPHRDYRGRTPLLLAAELGRMSAGAMLLDCGAKVYAIDFTGMYGKFRQERLT